MATWKKVIVSGSSAVLSNLALDTALPVGSGGTGASSLTDGGVLLGSGTGAITALGQATNGQLVVGSTGADPVLATLTGGANITVTNSAGGISIAATGLGSGTVQTVSATGTENGLTLTSDGDTVDPVITLGGTLGNITNTQLVNDGITIAGQDISLGGSITADTIAGQISATTITNGQLVNDGITIAGNDISLGGSITAATILAGTNVVSGSSDGVLSQGNGITAFSFDGSGDATVTVAADSTTGGNTKPVSVGANGVGFDISTIDGSGLGVSGGELIVNVDDSSIEVNADTLRVKAGGVTNAMLENDGITIAGNDTSLGGSITAATILGGTGVFSGSAQIGDYVANLGSLTGLTTTGNSGVGSTPTIAVAYGSTSNTAAQGNTGVTFLGTANEVELSTNTFTTVGGGGAVTIGLPNDVTIGNDLTVTNDMLVQGDLTVQGTASFQNQQNLEVADRFILMASGSNSTGDGGIVVQQATQNVGELFGFDLGATRWAVDSAFNAQNSSFTPEAFMAAVVEGTGNVPSEAAARYVKKGNLFVGANEDIYIYS
jgi:hypothetical protein